MTNPDPIATAARLDEAKAAHAAAVETHRQALGRWRTTADTHTAATAERKKLLARATDGGVVTPEDLRRAGDAERDAKDTADIQAAVAAGAKTAVHRSEITLAHAVVADFDGRKAVAGAAAFAALTAVDAAMDAVRAALVDADASLRNLQEFVAEARRHATYELPELLRRNPVLAARHASEHPKMKAPETPAALDLKPALIHTSDDHGGQRLTAVRVRRQPLATMLVALAPKAP